MDVFADVDLINIASAYFVNIKCGAIGIYHDLFRKHTYERDLGGVLLSISGIFFFIRIRIISTQSDLHRKKGDIT